MLEQKSRQLLRGSPFLDGLTVRERDAFINAGRERRVLQGAFFFHQGDPAILFYILVAGRVKLAQVTPQGHQVIVHYLVPGQGFGIIMALSNMDYPVSAEAVENCHALGWDAETTTQFMLQYPRLALNGMDLIARRFVQLQDRYRELATERVERRVAHTLLRLVRQMGKRVEEGVLIDMPLSRQDLGELTGTTLYTASRILSKWEKAGLVIAGRERVVLCKPHELVIIAEDLMK